MRALTIRNIDPALAMALGRERERRGCSLEQTAVELLRQSLGITASGRRSNGLRKLAGTWSANDKARFDAATQGFRTIDAEHWR